MPFRKTANGALAQRNMSPDSWGNFLDEQRPHLANGSRRTASQTPNLIAQASEILQEEFDPANYLLSHVTIVASVDTEEVPNVRTGSLTENGRRIVRKYSDYRVTPDTDSWVNNNGDSWARGTILKSYRTFIGADNFCFTPDTPVLMADGTYRPIRDVAVGDEVFTHEGRVRRVVHVFERDYEGDLVDIYVDRKRTPLSCTPNHPFPVVSRTHCACGCGRRLTATTLTRRQRLQRRFARGHDQRGPKDQSVAPWRVQAGGLKVGDLLTSPKVLIANSSNTLSYSEGRLLGYFLAEGAGFSSKENHLRFCLGTHEKEYIQEILDCARIVDPRCFCSVSPSSTTENGVVVYVGSRLLFQRMRELVDGGYSHNKTFAQASLWQEETVALGTLGAYINGDGDFHVETGRLRATSTSFNLLTQMQVVAARHGLHAVVCPRNNLGDVRQVMTNGGVRTVTARHEAYDLIFDQNSTARLSPYVGGGKDGDQGVRGHNAPLRDGGSYKIHSVSKVETRSYCGKVYNIEVADDHSYVVDGVGAFNCEHVQIPEQSKGRIIDAVARDIGPSIYTDILVATHRKHASLIRDIESGRMGTLSMGCSCVETTCTKCGNVAADETDLCDHIRYEKRNYFYDDQGKRRIIAELCGHPSLDPTAGITFIEASWVAVPAFRGAVVRNVLEPEILSDSVRQQAAGVLSTPPREWMTDDGIAKAARFKTPTKSSKVIVGGEDFAPPSEGADGDDGDAADKDPLSALEDEVEKILLDRVKQRIRKKLDGDAEKGSPGELATSSNDNVVHQGSTVQSKLAEGTSALLRIASSEVELIDAVARLEQSYGLKISRDIYRTALRVGSAVSLNPLETYLARCAEVLDRQPTSGENAALVRLGRLLSMWKRTT